jgi:hypothetical protein
VLVKRRNLIPRIPGFMDQRTAGGRARQLAAIPLELTIHQDVLHSPGNLVRIDIGCGVKNRSWVGVVKGTAYLMWAF